MSEAIIYLTQNGALQQLEKEKLQSSECSKSASKSSSEAQSLGPRPFAGLFIISGSVSIIGLIIGAIRLLRSHWERFTFMQTMLISKGICSWLETFFTLNKTKNEIEL